MHQRNTCLNMFTLIVLDLIPFLNLSKMNSFLRARIKCNNDDYYEKSSKVLEYLALGE